MATAPKVFNADSEPRLDVKKGDRVRLLQPLYDGVQYFYEGEVISWPLDTPPTTAQAANAKDKATPLDAPVFSDAKPPADYIDPRTGQPLVIERGV